jgi:hypothetical protein
VPRANTTVALAVLLIGVLLSGVQCGGSQKNPTPHTEAPGATAAETERPSDRCFSNTDFHANPISRDSFEQEVTRARDLLNVSRLPVPVPPSDVASIETGIIPSNNDTGDGFNIQFNWSSADAPVVGFLFTKAPLCFKPSDRKNASPFSYGGQTATVFPFELTPGGLIGQRAWLHLADTYTEIDVLWDPKRVPDKDVQRRMIEKWVTAVVQQSGT